VANKEIKISATIDAQQFDQQVQRIEQKLNSINKPQQQVDSFRQANQKMKDQGFQFDQQAEQKYKTQTTSTKREMDDFIRKSSNNIKAFDNVLDRQKQKLEQLKTLKKSLNDEEQKTLQITEKIAATQDKINRATTAKFGNTKGLNTALDQRAAMDPGVDPRVPHNQRPQGMERMANAYQRGGMGGAGRAGWRMFKANPYGIAGGIASAIGTAGMVGEGLYRDAVVNRPERIAGAQGSAATGISDMAQATMGGRLNEEMFFNEERKTALDRATKMMDQKRAADTRGLGWRGAMIGGGALAVKGGLAAMGTGVGAVPGGIAAIGGGIAMGTGIMSTAGNPRMRAALMDKMGMDGDGEYNSMVNQDFIDDVRRNVEFEKQKNPFGRMVMQQYSGRGQNIYGMQQKLGMDDKQTFGSSGFYQQAYDAQFRNRDIEGMSNAIMSAGGSTRAGGQGGVAALQASRNFDLTNAGNIMGKASNMLGDSGSSEQVLVRTLAESVRLGLDSSQFSEEQRQFTQQLSDIAIQAGTGSASEMGNIMNQAADYMGSTSRYGIGAGVDNFKMMQQIGSRTTGPRGALQAAAIENDPMLSQLGDDERAYMAKMQPQFINMENEDIRNISGGLFDKTGGVLGDQTFDSKEDFQKEFVKRGKGAKRKSTFLRAETDEYSQQIRDLYKGENYGKDGPTAQQQEVFMDSPEVSKILTKMKTSGSFGDEDMSSMINSPEKFKRFMYGQATAGMGGGAPAGVDQVGQTVDGLGRSVGTRVGEETQKAGAAGDQVANEEFKREYKKILNSARNAATYSAEMTKAIFNFTETIKSGSGATEEAMQAAIANYRAVLAKETNSGGSSTPPIGTQEKRVQSGGDSSSGASGDF